MEPDDSNIGRFCSSTIWMRKPSVVISSSNWFLNGRRLGLASMIAPLVWMQAVHRLGPSRTTLFFNLLPLVTALIAAVVLDEQLARYHLVGGLLTLAGVVLAERWTTPIRR